MMDKKAELVPFHALNEFMRPDFRMAVVRAALMALPDLPEDLRRPLDQLTKKHVKVHGFRNPEKAPALSKAGPLARAFENHPDLVAAVLGAWAESRAELRAQVFTLLKERGWFLLPLEARRDKLPGFFINWPKSEDFEVLNEAFKETHPESTASTDEVSLMIVWISARLPYQMIEDSPEAVTKLVNLDLEQLIPGKSTNSETSTLAGEEASGLPDSPPDEG